MSQQPSESLVKAAHLVDNEFGLGLYFEALEAEGVRWSTQDEMDALIKMGQQVLVDRPLERQHNAASSILKAASTMFPRSSSSPASCAVAVPSRSVTRSGADSVRSTGRSARPMRPLPPVSRTFMRHPAGR